jgi:hypothetical protein
LPVNLRFVTVKKKSVNFIYILSKKINFSVNLKLNLRKKYFFSVNLIFITLKANFCHSIKNNKKFILTACRKIKNDTHKAEIFFKIYKIKKK